MTVTEYAAHRGVSRQTIYNALRGGRIKKAPCGKLESVDCDARWDPKATINAATEAQRERGDADDDGEDDGYDYDYQSARARREHYTADLTELKAQAEKGEMVPVKEVERAWTDILSTLKTRLLSLPDRVCDVLAVTDDSHACQQILADEVTDILEQAAKDVGADE